MECSTLEPRAVDFSDGSELSLTPIVLLMESPKNNSQLIVFEFSFDKSLSVSFKTISFLSCIV